MLPRESKWLWFIFTLTGSLLPAIIRCLVATKSSIPYVDMKDILFAGMAISLSNFTLVGNNKVFIARDAVIGISMLTIVLATAVIVVYLIIGDVRVNKFGLLEGVSIFIFSISAGLSYKANQYIL